ncbi:MAG: hypothetical protein QOI15_2793, partial [Pseudonocardiales bacterium]|nr:hypothetical protein [Pseudonocardiales bacterium]
MAADAPPERSADGDGGRRRRHLRPRQQLPAVVLHVVAALAVG